MKEKINVLVTGAGGDIGQSIGKILLKSSYIDKLIGCDINDKNAGSIIFANFNLVSPINIKSAKYMKELEALIEHNSIDIIVVTSEQELRHFNKICKSDGIGNAKFIMSSSKSQEIGFDKLKTAEFLEAEGLPFPKTYMAKDYWRLNNFPFILKLRQGSGSKGIFLVDCIEDFIFYTRKSMNTFIVQEYLPNDNGEFTCGLFRSSKGVVRSIIFKRNLTDGYSSYGEVIENKTITTLLENLAVKLDLVGSINVQLRLDHDNVPKIFEINPRFSSTVLFRHLLGFEDLIWSIEDHLGTELSYNRQDAIGKKFFKGFQEYIK
jgi:carbamoyl-phosphate synthase large subunit